MRADVRDRLPKGEGWLYEVKFDGYRMRAHKTGNSITLYTRNGADWTADACTRAEPYGGHVADSFAIHQRERKR